MLAFALTAVTASLASATTTIGPELVERFAVRDAGAFDVGMNDVVIAHGRSVERRAMDGRVIERVELPCAVIDVTVADKAWAALCSDRVIVRRERFFDEPVEIVLPLQVQSAPPVAVGLVSFHGAYAVAYEDGYVMRGRFERKTGALSPMSGSAASELDLRGRPVALAMSGIDDVTIALADGTRHNWGIGGVREEPRASPRLLIELYGDVNGVKRARVSTNVSVRSATTMHAAREAVAVSSSSSTKVNDVALAPNHELACVRSDGVVRCYAKEAPPPPEIARRDEDDDDDSRSFDEAPRAGTPAPPGAGAPSPEFEAPIDFGTPGVIAALIATVAGTGASVSAPFVMQALSPSLGIGPAFALAGLGAVGGVASFAVVASAVIIVGAIIIAAIPDDHSSSSNAGACAPGVRMLESAIDDCICAIATIAAIVGAVVATVSVGVAVLSIAAMPPVDEALTGRAPDNDPFFATLGGATAGAVVGFGIGTGISLVTAPLRDEDGDDEPDDDVAALFDNLQTMSFVIGGSAVGASIAYGVSRGP